MEISDLQLVGPLICHRNQSMGSVHGLDLLLDDLSSVFCFGKDP